MIVFLALGTGFLIKAALVSLGTAALAGVGKAVLVGAVAEAVSRNIDIDISGIPGFDQPFVLMSGQALSMVNVIIDYTFNFIQICAFLCIVFNALKLMFGMIETKKAFVDIVTKILIVMLCMFAYPTFIVKTYNLSVEMGIKASGGEKHLTATFANLALSIKDVWEKGSAEFVTIMQNGVRDSRGNIIVSDELIKTFANAGNMSKEDIEEYLAQNNMVRGETHAKGVLWWENNQKKTEKAAKKALKNKLNTKFMKQSLAILQSLTTILTGETTLSGTSDGDSKDVISAQDLLTTGDDALSKIFFNPFIKDTEIPLLSTSAMVKAAIIIAEIAGAGAGAGYTNILETDETMSISQMVESKKPGIFTKWLGNIGIQFVYKLLLVISVIIVMMEYIITVVEYFIVAGISALLIPFYFIDATKNFATNILKTIFTYAIKLITTITMAFFTIGMYINLGNFMLSRTDLSALSTVFIYVFYCVIGIALVKNTGGLAATVITGTPSMGLKDVVAGVHSMAHGARTINGLANTAAKGVKNTVQSGIHGAMDAKSTLDGAAAAKTSTLENARLQNALLKMGQPEAAGMTEKQMKSAANASWWQTVGDSMKQKAGDSLYKAFTGQEKKRSGQDGNTLSYGQTFTDKDDRQQKADFGDMQRQAKAKGESVGKEKVDKFFKGKDGTGGYNGAAMSTITDAQNNQNSQTQKKQGPGTQEFGKTNVRGREAGLPD